MTGSRQGLFFSRIPPYERIFVCEGPTDTAALMSFDVAVVGRPSCLGCEDMIQELIERNHVKEVVLVPDHDKPGLDGAERLQSVVF